MSKEAVQKVIGRAIADQTFRNLLLNNPDQALAGFDLTAEEISALKGIDRESLSAGTAELEARISKSMLLFGIKGEAQEDQHKDWVDV